MGLFSHIRGLSAAVVLLFAGLGPGFALAEPLPVEEVAPGVFVHAGIHEDANPQNLGDIANIGFIIGNDAVAVIDTGGSPTIGRRLREAIQARTDRPIRYVINTHMHPDHVFGNAAFRDDRPQFVGHENLLGALMARADTYQQRFEQEVGASEAAALALVPPDLTVGDRLELDLGGRILELVAWPTAHTNNDLTITDRRTGTLWTGDLVFMERIPSIDGSALGWLRVLDRLAELPAERIVPGHGPVTADWPAGLTGTRRYLETLVSEIRALQRKGGTIEQAVAEVGQPEQDRWLLFEDYHPRNVVTVFAELEWE